MTIDKQKMLEEAQRTVASGDGLLMTVRAKDVMGLLVEIERLERETDQAKADGADAFGLAQGRADTIDQLKAENEALKSPETGYAGAFYDFCRLVGVANASPESPASVFKGQVVPAVEALRKDAERWTFFKDLSCQIQAFPHSWGQMTPEKMDFMCDEAMTKGAKQ